MTMAAMAGDVEKGGEGKVLAFHETGDSSNSTSSIAEGQVETTKAPWWEQQWRTFIADFTEARGIDRVPSEGRVPATKSVYVQMFSLWASANLTANHVALGTLGPVIWGLSFLDTALTATFGILLGSLCIGYMATFGPQSGNRTMVIARYSMGWWPSRICVLLNIVIMLGYGMIDCVVGGQMLSAIAGGQNLSIAVGVFIIAVLTWSITFIGMPVLHVYERYGWIPQAAVLFILAGCAGPYFDLSTRSTGNSTTIIANRISMFTLCLSAPASWSPAGADFYVYYAENTSKVLTFILTCLGASFGYLFAIYLGAGIATGLVNKASWADAHEISPGALLVAGHDGLGSFGKFCSVILMLGVIANNVPGTYSCGLGFQCLGSWPLKVPRQIWNTLAVIVYTVCGAIGRNHLYDIFQNFLALMGYWTTIWIVITLEEQLIFRREKGYVWEHWNDRTKLPVGLAALVTFIIGWIGAVLSMDQTYFVGPIAELVGDYGSDMGVFIGLSWAAIVFPGLRYLEQKYIGR